MAKISENSLRVTSSVFDRLLDFEPKNTREAPKSSQMALRDLKQAVKRDLEWLLNSRRSVWDVPENLTEVNDSIAVYGLPDMTTFSIDSGDDRSRLVGEVEKALLTFDRRFKNPKVILEPANEVERQLKFRIEAILDIDPAPEPVVFDTVLEAGSMDFSVKDAS